MLTVSSVSKIYHMGDVIVPALSEIDLHVSAGELLCITGKSGSGKSTLLHLLGLIDTPSNGKIIFQNQDTSRLSEKRRSSIRLSQMGFVFQEYALLPELTALENIYLPAKMLGKWSGDYEDRAVTLLESLGLIDRMHHRPSQLSGGQQQRVAIARAMVNKPEVIFADEPTANLDSIASKQVMQSLAWLNAQFQTTIIYVSHEGSDREYASRTVEIADGRILQVVEGVA